MAMAASLKASLMVGCAWHVRPMSSALAPYLGKQVGGLGLGLGSGLGLGYLYLGKYVAGALVSIAVSRAST